MSAPSIVSPEVHGHFVQFYKADEPMLNRNVGQFLWDGFLRGDGLVVIATPARRECLAGHLAWLGADVSVAVKQRQLVMVDAQEMLDRLMVDGEPDWHRFQAAIDETLQMVQPREPGATIRAYGEMVGILWELGQREAAIRLEESWNKLLPSYRISLFCGYPIDVFAEDFETSHVHDVLHAHSHLMPTGPNGNLNDAVQQAMNDVLGEKAKEVWGTMNASAKSVEFPTLTGEGAILWLRKNAPQDAQEILANARRHFSPSDGQQYAG